MTRCRAPKLAGLRGARRRGPARRARAAPARAGRARGAVRARARRRARARGAADARASASTLDRGARARGRGGRRRVDARRRDAVERLDVLVELPPGSARRRRRARSRCASRAASSGSSSLRARVPTRWGGYALGARRTCAPAPLGLFVEEGPPSRRRRCASTRATEELRRLLAPRRDAALAGNEVARDEGRRDRVRRHPAVRRRRPDPPHQLAGERAPRRAVGQRDAIRSGTPTSILFLDSFAEARARRRRARSTWPSAPPRRSRERYLARRDRVGLVGFGGIAPLAAAGDGPRPGLPDRRRAARHRDRLLVRLEGRRRPAAADAAAAGARDRALAAARRARASAPCSTCAPAASTSPSSTSRRCRSRRAGPGSTRPPTGSGGSGATRCATATSALGVAVAEWRDGRAAAGRDRGGAVVQASRAHAASVAAAGRVRAGRRRLRRESRGRGAPARAPPRGAGLAVAARRRIAAAAPGARPLVALRRSARSTPRPCAAASTAGRSRSRAGLLLAAELAYWSIENDRLLREEPAVALRHARGNRGARRGDARRRARRADAAGLQLAAGLPLAAAGAVAAVGLLLLIARLARAG